MANDGKPEQTEIVTQGASKALAKTAPMRMALPPVVAEQFGIDAIYWKALTEVVFPSAESVDAIVMALAYCRARNLDVMKKVVHVVPIWNQKAGKTVEGIWPGISELRTTAMRTNNYAGRMPTIFGPDKTAKVGNVDVTFPEWAQVTVLRLLAGRVYEFAGPQVFWAEAYSSKGKDPSPNAMWAKRPRGQLDKCAEAAALRAAFPEEIGGEIAAEEVQYSAFAETPKPITKTVELTHQPQDEIIEEPVEKPTVGDTPKVSGQDKPVAAPKPEAEKPAPTGQQEDDLPAHVTDAPPVGEATQSKGDAGEQLKEALEANGFEVVDAPFTGDDDFPGDRKLETRPIDPDIIVRKIIARLPGVIAWADLEALMALGWDREEWAVAEAASAHVGLYSLVKSQAVWRAATDDDKLSYTYQRIMRG